MQKRIIDVFERETGVNWSKQCNLVTKKIDPYGLVHLYTAFSTSIFLVRSLDSHLANCKGLEEQAKIAGMPIFHKEFIKRFSYSALPPAYTADVNVQEFHSALCQTIETFGEVQIANYDLAEALVKLKKTRASAEKAAAKYLETSFVTTVGGMARFIESKMTKIDIEINVQERPRFPCSRCGSGGRDDDERTVTLFDTANLKQCPHTVHWACIVDNFFDFYTKVVREASGEEEFYQNTDTVTCEQCEHSFPTSEMQRIAFIVAEQKEKTPPLHTRRLRKRVVIESSDDEESIGNKQTRTLRLRKKSVSVDVSGSTSDDGSDSEQDESSSYERASATVDEKDEEDGAYVPDNDFANEIPIDGNLDDSESSSPLTQRVVVKRKR